MKKKKIQELNTHKKFISVVFASSSLRCDDSDSADRVGIATAQELGIFTNRNSSIPRQKSMSMNEVRRRKTATSPFAVETDEIDEVSTGQQRKPQPNESFHSSKQQRD